MQPVIVKLMKSAENNVYLIHFFSFFISFVKKIYKMNTLLNSIHRKATTAPDK